MQGKLLVVDDDAASCRLVTALFGAEGLDVITAHDGPSGVRRAIAEQPDLVLLDLQLPGLDGLQVLERIRAAAPLVPVVMITSSRDVKNAVRAIQIGALDYLTKPMDQEEAVAVVQRALESRRLRVELQTLRSQASTHQGQTVFAQMGHSPQVQEIVGHVATVAASTFTVLILGETGTGKELVAQAIHAVSDRRGRPLVALDCGAIPDQLLESELFGHEKGAFTGAERRKEGRFRLAEEGTCFLDEVGNLPMPLQAKLLRALESKQIQPIGAERPTPMDVRFIAATNVDLRERVNQGLFRADLYFRLAQYTIPVPALRDRVEDIPYLTERFVREASVELRRPVQAIVPDALEALRHHTWPGNVRELRNVVRQAVLQTNDLVIRADVIRALIAQVESVASSHHASGGRSLREVAADAAAAAERHAICDALRLAAGNKSQAARALRTDFKTLHLKMKQLGIRANDFSL
jgi:two-component system, NtrC family, response regulator HydG